MSEVAEIAGLTQAQRDVLLAAAAFLDAAAGEGVGIRDVNNPERMCFADDICVAAAEAFGLTMTDTETPFASAVRAHLANDRREG